MWRIGNCVAYTDSYGSLDLYVGFTPVNVIKFWRLEKQKSLYYSKEYIRTSKINNYTILYDQDGTEKFGLIKYFLELQRITNNTSEVFVIAVIDELCTAPFVRGSVIIPHLQTIAVYAKTSLIGYSGMLGVTHNYKPPMTRPNKHVVLCDAQRFMNIIIDNVIIYNTNYCTQQHTS